MFTTEELKYVRKFIIPSGSENVTINTEKTKTYYIRVIFGLKYNEIKCISIFNKSVIVFVIFDKFKARYGFMNKGQQSRDGIFIEEVWVNVIASYSYGLAWLSYSGLKILPNSKPWQQKTNCSP